MHFHGDLPERRLVDAGTRPGAHAVNAHSGVHVVVTQAPPSPVPAVRDLEDCVGHGLNKFGTYVPRQCEHRADFIVACIEGYQRAAERRNEQCPSSTGGLQQGQGAREGGAGGCSASSSS